MADKVILVMGVSGSGKSTLGVELARALHCAFVEADDFHPEANIARMRQGRPLDDTMRGPWLDAVADAVAATPGDVVLACSALKRSHRGRLRRRLGDLCIIHLAGDRDLIEGRIAARRGHYMPASLAASQFAALEPPGADENAVTLSVDRQRGELLAAMAAAVSLC